MGRCLHSKGEAEWTTRSSKIPLTPAKLSFCSRHQEKKLRKAKIQSYFASQTLTLSGCSEGCPLDRVTFPDFHKA